jgi:hypothetical protein
MARRRQNFNQQVRKATSDAFKRKNMMESRRPLAPRMIIATTQRLKTVPTRFLSTNNRLYDTKAIWKEEEARVDFSRIYFTNDDEARPRTEFQLWTAEFPGNKHPTLRAKLPIHYRPSLDLIAHQHAWCRDFLILGRWDHIDDTAEDEEDENSVLGSELKEGLIRFMRYYSNLLQEVIKEAQEAKGKLLASLRLPTLDFHLLRIWNGWDHTEETIELLFRDARSVGLLKKDPMKFGMLPT